MDDQTLKLVNSYIDGTISSADMQNLQLLLESDAVLAQDMKLLVRQRKLCLSDKTPAPQGLSEQVMRKLKQNQYHRHAHHKFGARRFFNVAAIAMMALLLGSVLLVIIGPFATGKGRGVRNVAVDVPEQYAETFAAAPSAIDAQPMLMASKIQTSRPELSNYYLTFSTKNIAKAERVLGQLFYEYNLLDGVNVSREPGQTVYKVECSRDDLASLAGGVSPMWAAADNVSLEFADYTSQTRLNVPGITQPQLERIVNADEVESKVKNAAVASAMNSLPAVPMNDFEKGYDQPATLMSMRPVLAGARHTRKPQNTTPKYLTVSIKIENAD